MSLHISRLAIVAFTLVSGSAFSAEPSPITLRYEQITHGPNHHFFGYIGHVRTIPWNGTNRYILALRTDFQDRMPEPAEPADIVLIDTQNDFSIEKIEESRAWNFQQGTMFYWNPTSPETQFFFNDRDPETHRVFTVLFDIETRERIREYRFEDSPVANGGVMQGGGSFAAINYGRLARLRRVTGYQGAYDWTAGVAHPEDDGIFKVNIETGERTLIVSYAQMASVLREAEFPLDDQNLFVNHTLWSRGDARMYTFARANWNERGVRINVPLSFRADGSELTAHSQHMGGHPEWLDDRHIIGSLRGEQALYDVVAQRVTESWGDRAIFPNPEGDIALSPDGDWFVNGADRRGRNIYTVLHRPTQRHTIIKATSVEGWSSGDLRIDGSPAWNRTSDVILIPGLADDGTRQLFLLYVEAGA